MKKKTKLAVFYLGILTFLIYVPLIVAVVFSFNESKTSTSWTGFTLKWYVEVLKDKSLQEAVVNSIILGLTASVLSTLIAVPAAIGFSRRQSKTDRIIKNVTMVPLMIPEIILATAYLSFFRLFNIPFGMLTLILGHMSFCVPYVFLQIESRVAMMDKSGYEAARIMGAGPIRAFFDVTVPFLAPAVASGMFLSFAMSIDDVIISSFVTGVNVNTLALKIYSQVKTTITPKVNAVCTLLLLTMLLCLFLARLFRKIKTQQ